MGTVVHLLFVDEGTFCNIIFKKTLDQLGDYKDYIQPCEHMVRGFGDANVKPTGIIRLIVEFVSI